MTEAIQLPKCRSVAIFGGAGKFGRLGQRLFNRFAPDVAVYKFDANAKSNGSFIGFEQACMCDVIILAFPFELYEQELQKIIPFVRAHNPSAVIVDVATVKVHTRDLLRKYAQDLNWLSIHPNFGPGAYKKRRGRVKGLRIFLAEFSMEEEAFTPLLAFIESLGFVVTEITAEEHDRVQAETLYVAHRTSQIWKAAGIKRTPYDTPSFALMMDGYDMVSGDDPLFAAMRKLNPYCAEIDHILDRAEAAVLRPFVGELGPIPLPYQA